MMLLSKPNDFNFEKIGSLKSDRGSSPLRPSLDPPLSSMPEMGLQKLYKDLTSR